jgi:hypothetical protein
MYTNNDSVKSRFHLFTVFFLSITVVFCFPTFFLVIIKSLDFFLDIELIWIPLLLLSFIWILIVEVYVKTNSITFLDNTIKISRILGLTSEKEINLTEFDGFYTVNIHYKSGSYEHLFLIKNNKRYCAVTEFYHSNYQELKAVASKKLKDLGPIKSNLFKELINSFKI